MYFDAQCENRVFDGSWVGVVASEHFVVTVAFVSLLV